MADVEGLAHPAIVRHLFVMAAALSGGALLLGASSDRLRRHHVSPKIVLAITAAAFVAAEVLLILRVPIPSFVLWAIIASVGAATVLSYAILAQYFPKEIAGQTNAALNLFHIGGAFVFQSVIGLMLEWWPSHGGHYPPAAYETALGVLIAIQIVALAWFASRKIVSISVGILRLRLAFPPREIHQPRSARTCRDILVGAPRRFLRLCQYGERNVKPA
jgi:hypothetical protein